MATMMALPTVAVSIFAAASVCAQSSEFSSVSGVRMSSKSFAAPLRLSGGARKSSTVVQSSPQPQETSLEGAVENAIRDATNLCAEVGSKTTEFCANAWDNVEELAAALSHKKQSLKQQQSDDPLEEFCKDAPEADECRVYED